MFLASEGEAIKNAIENLRGEAAELRAEADSIERAWKNGERSALRSYLPTFVCPKCKAHGESAIEDIGEDCETGENFAICKCGHECYAGNA